MITIDHMHFEVIENYRDAFDEEQFSAKYSEVLNKYDYIVGDIGYEKLRLTGFYRDNKGKVDRDKKFSAIQDYLYEYCNFGCAYFIVRKVPKAEVKEMQEAGTLPVEAEDSGENTGSQNEGRSVSQEEQPAGAPESTSAPGRDAGGSTQPHKEESDTRPKKQDKKHEERQPKPEGHKPKHQKRPRGRHQSGRRKVMPERKHPGGPKGKTLAAHQAGAPGQENRNDKKSD